MSRGEVCGLTSVVTLGLFVVGFVERSPVATVAGIFLGLLTTAMCLDAVNEE